jgi:hypothetical protein
MITQELRSIAPLNRLNGSEGFRAIDCMNKFGDFLRIHARRQFGTDCLELMNDGRFRY